MSAIAAGSHPVSRESVLPMVATRAFFGLFLLSGLQAYNIGPVPIDWLAQFGFIALAVVLLLCGRPVSIPSLRPYAVLLIWAVLVTAYQAGTRDFSIYMPEISTTPYPLFIALRFAAIAGFLAAAYCVVWLLQYGAPERIRVGIVLIATFLALVALYIYVAPSLGLPEPPRTRLGTGGKEQSTVFTYAFHRALGTFREPSHLAAWLVLPFFLSLIRKGLLPPFSTLVIGAAILLTGSLTGILSVTIGFTVASLFFGARKSVGLRASVRVGLVFLAALGVFSIFIQFGKGARADLFTVLIDRIGPIFATNGFTETNRGYIYSYIQQVDYPAFGLGLGHANLLMGRDLGFGLLGNFASLYLNVWAATGFAGVILLAYGLLRPLAVVWLRRFEGDPTWIWAAIGAYVSWLTVFAVLYEELSIGFGVVLAFLWYATRSRPEGSTA